MDTVNPAKFLPGWVPAVARLGFGVGAILLLDHQSIVQELKEEIPTILSFIGGKDYDEALERSYRDGTNRFVKRVAMFLVQFTSFLLFLLHFVDKPTVGSIETMLYVFYAGLWTYRVDSAMDPLAVFEVFDKIKLPFSINWGAKKTLVPLVNGHIGEYFKETKCGRPFYLLYPVIDERTAFSRETAMDRSNRELFRKGENLKLKKKAESAIHTFTTVFLWGVWYLFTKRSLAVFSFLNLVVSGAMFHALVENNFGPVKILDGLQQYFFMRYFKLPAKSIASPNHYASRKNWESQGELGIAHYYHHGSWFRPWSEFIHKNVFVLSKKQHGMTIGQSMAAVAFVKGLVFWLSVLTVVHPIIDASQSSKGLDQIDEEKTRVFRLVVALGLLSVNYGIHGSFKYLWEDRAIGYAKNRALQREEKVKNTFFLGYQIAAGVVDYATFTLPLIHLFMSA